MGCQYHISFFAYDSALFCNATVEEAQGVVDVLKVYVCGSGQEINMLQSSIFFGSKATKRNKKKIE